MKQLLILTRMQLGSAFDFIKLGHKKDKKKNASVMAILGGAFLLFFACSFMYSFSIGYTLQMFGELDTLIGLLMSATCFVTILTSVYKVKGILFGFKDYDIVMSLPVRTSIVVASRLLLLYLINIFFTIIFMLPGIIVYGYLVRPSVEFYVMAGISLFFIPLIPIIVASVIGLLLTLISNRFRYSNAVSIILTIAVFVMFMIGSFSIQSDEQLIEFGKMMRDKMNSIYPIAEFYMDGIIQRNILSYLIFLGVSVLLFVIYSFVVGRMFKKLNSGVLAKHASGKFTYHSRGQQSSLMALYKKEAKRFFSTNIYLMNAGVGVILLILGAVMVFFIKSEEMTMILNTPEILTIFQEFLPFAIAAMISMSATTASSVSLEGKSLWIIKSAPIEVKDWFLSKILVNLTITVPGTVIAGILLGIFFKLSVFQMIICLVFPIAYSYLSSVFGLLINLKFPMLDWTSETVVVKQSAASMIGSFCPMLAVGLPVVLKIVFRDINSVVFLLVTTVVVLTSAILLHHRLNKNGNRILLKL